MGDSSAPSTPSSPSAPERVGRYEIILPIASGGMATVYLARAVGSNGFVNEVALKLTHAHLRTIAEFSNDLVEEGKLAARIRHRNVVSVIDVGDDPNGLYLVLEYIEGDTLAGLMRGADAIPTPMAIRLLLDALAGLHAAHELREDDGSLVGVVHRDFTPQNILVGADGVARLADFGIAKAATRISHTRTGMVKGKIAYMAPEQAHGLPLDRRCDVWAAGVVAWELFAGRRLHGHDEELATMLKVATVAPPLLSSVAPGVPVQIEDAVAGALEMRLDDRLPTAQAFSRALAAACRATIGVAEVDEVAAWMNKHVGPKLASRRQQVTRARAVRDDRDRTRVETPVARSATQKLGSWIDDGDLLSAAHTVTADPRKAPTQLLPTVASEPEPRQLTDGVSVVGRHYWRTARSLAVGPRAWAGGGIVAALLIVSLAAWRVSVARSDARKADEPVVHSVLATGSPTPGSGSPSAPAAAPSLRLRANAPIAALRVNGHDVPVARPALTIDIGLAGLTDEPSLSIDAVASDGRRAAVAVPTEVAEVSLEFPQRPLPQGPPVRPAGTHRGTTTAAPLASSPYN